MKSVLNRMAFVFLALIIVSSASAQSSGADVYKSTCAMCHGADGLGSTPVGKALKAASFKNPAIEKASDAELIATVTKGKSKMPAYGGKLTNAQIKAVIGYVRALQK